MSGPSILALVPSRAGSKRVKAKNIRHLNSHPLLAYAIAAAREASIFARIVVSSEDESTRHLAQSYGAEAVARPEAYAQDWSPDIDWVNHAMVAAGETMDAFCILRPTSPFRRGAWIRAAWEYLQANPHADSLRAFRPATEHVGKMWVTTAGGRIAQPLMPFRTTAAPFHSCPTQEIPLHGLVYQTAALEIAWARVLPGSISGDVVLPWIGERDAPESEDVNTIQDWDRVTRLAAEHPEWLPEVRG